jgi:dienelactone hydrolase
VPISVLQRDRSKPLEETFNMKSWFEKHTYDSIERHIKSLYSHLRTASGATSDLGAGNAVPIAAIGYCYGGKFALRVSSWAGIDTIVAFHPVRICYSDDDFSEFRPSYSKLILVLELCPAR